MENLIFETRSEFRKWLDENVEGPGVWLLFGKRGGPKTLSAAEALEEALCAGWIDGQMQSLDEKTYIKYFAPRRPGSNWSEKNKGLVNQLMDKGLMRSGGLKAVETAKANGSWDKEKGPVLDSPENIEELAGLLDGHEPACSNFKAKPESVRKTYSRMYFDAKSDSARERRLAKIIDRLNQNLNPM